MWEKLLFNTYYNSNKCRRNDLVANRRVGETPLGEREKGGETESGPNDPEPSGFLEMERMYSKGPDFLVR